LTKKDNCFGALRARKIQHHCRGWDSYAAVGRAFLVQDNQQDSLTGKSGERKMSRTSQVLVLKLTWVL